MSASKSGKRISVFDRLGPADEVGGAHVKSCDNHAYMCGYWEVGVVNININLRLQCTEILI